MGALGTAESSAFESSLTDINLAGIASGFTLGFGVLTVWKAIKQTMMVRSPRRSIYVILVWIEIFANFAIAILAWLLIEGILPCGSLAVLLPIYLNWVCQVQCAMQIIINRIYVVAEDRDWVQKVKWATAIFISTINVIVGCIWLPSHVTPPRNPRFVEANRIWDPISKALICSVDASLNIWFLVIVRRIVKFYGLTKYELLVRFNARLIIVSVSLDALIIGLLFAPNPLLYLTFHPVAYVVKLNIEMTMASLIWRLVRAQPQATFGVDLASTGLSELRNSTLTAMPRDAVSV